MSANLERPHDAGALTTAPHGGLDDCEAVEAAQTLAALPTGAHLIVRCRKDWRTATVVFIAPDKITLSVAAPSGRTYRLRRPPDAPLTFEGAIPLLGEGPWRAALALYDKRW
ncbi:MAG: hypothetical protein H7Y30_07735 [Pyrinomonadaceae bacterium]|nr:hypothetical protein [Pyrinomonadaceae bacterium]